MVYDTLSGSRRSATSDMKNYRLAWTMSAPSAAWESDPVFPLYLFGVLPQITDARGQKIFDREISQNSQVATHELEVSPRATYIDDHSQ